MMVGWFARGCPLLFVSKELNYKRFQNVVTHWERNMSGFDEYGKHDAVSLAALVNSGEINETELTRATV